MYFFSTGFQPTPKSEIKIPELEGFFGQKYALSYLQRGHRNRAHYSFMVEK
jgi:hypothetical protein